MVYHGTGCWELLVKKMCVVNSVKMHRLMWEWCSS